MATIVIGVNAVDLTDIIMFEDATFDSRVNGEPGSCNFRVRDDDNNLSFEAGQSITVDVNGEREWAGYLMQATSTYIYPAGDVTINDVPRIWRITGVDLNILFRRRVVFDGTDPTVMTGKTYKYTGTPTADTTAIADLVADFLDLSGDSIDTSAFVDNVGNINVDQDVNAFGASWTWEQAMASIASLPAAIYYIDPERNLVYTDVDTPNAPFALSDQPNGITSFGYREPELLKDASNLINDYLAWGIGTGSNEPVFSRLEDATSVAAHGRWQQASLTYDVYTQATVDRIADSWINGSPTSQRGHKDDKVAFMCTIFEPGIRAGMKVDVTSNVFAFNDVIPVRECRLSFANQIDPIYRLTLSHAIDAPWSFYQMFNPSIPRLAWDDQFTLAYPCDPDDPSSPCYCREELVIDHFDRTRGAGTGLGTATIGTTWVRDTSGAPQGNYASVDGDKAIFPYPNSPPPGPADVPSPWDLGLGLNAIDSNPWLEFRWLCELVPDASSRGGGQHRISGGGNTVLWRIVDPIGATPTQFQFGRAGGFTVVLNKADDYYGGGQFWVAMKIETFGAGTILYFKAWLISEPEPANWEADSSAFSNPLTLLAINSLGLDSGISVKVGFELQVDEILIQYPCADQGNVGGVGTTDGTDTFDLGAPFWKGTSRVWLDGEAQELGVDYSEDYDGGLIIFTSTPAAGLDVVVTRCTRTPLGGGASRRVI